jgi:hypothetical protein
MHIRKTAVFLDFSSFSVVRVEFVLAKWSVIAISKLLIVLLLVDVGTGGHSMTTWTQFCPFLTTTYLYVDIFMPKRGQK